MSYRHCDLHDCEATNGCPTCMANAAEAEADAAVEPLVAEFLRWDRERPGEFLWRVDDDPVTVLRFRQLAREAFKLGRHFGP